MYEIKHRTYSSLVLLLAACSPIANDPPAATQLAPVAAPTYAVGTTYNVWDLIDDKAGSWKVVAVDGETFTAQTETGCRFTNRDPLLPVLSWENCGDDAGARSGTRTYTSSQGSLWPLQVGSEARYAMTWTTNDGKTDSGSLDCSVDGSAHITTRSGEHDAYRVVCIQSWNGVTRRRVTYWAPDLGPVKFTNTHSKKGTTDSWELVSIDRVQS